MPGRGCRPRSTTTPSTAPARCRRPWCSAPATAGSATTRPRASRRPGPGPAWRCWPTRCSRRRVSPPPDRAGLSPARTGTRVRTETGFRMSDDNVIRPAFGVPRTPAPEPEPDPAQAPLRVFGTGAGHRVGLIRDPSAVEGDVIRVVVGPEDERRDRGAAPRRRGDRGRADRVRHPAGAGSGRGRGLNRRVGGARSRRAGAAGANGRRREGGGRATGGKA